MRQFNMGWGNAVAVRSAFLDQTSGRPVIFGLKELEQMNYPPHCGEEALIEVTRRVIQRQVGLTYNHIILTNGAAGGVTLALRAYAGRGCNTAFTRQAPYFPIYPAMIKSAGLRHVVEADNRLPGDRPVALIDSPTNPHGLIVSDTSMISPPRIMLSDGEEHNMPLIWDAVYHSAVYLPPKFYPPLQCDVIVGSYSKLLGLNGLRTGWVATNDYLFYQRLKELVTAEYCGLSSASTSILLQLLKPFKDERLWEGFERQARFNLDYNRGEWSKLERFFGGTPTGPNGMFYYSYMDGSCKKLMGKSNIVWTPGSSCGHYDEFGRFNIGQDMKIVKAAVKEVLKNDRI